MSVGSRNIENAIITGGWTAPQARGPTLRLARAQAAWRTRRPARNPNSR